jgi:hypothetical protein
MISFNRIVGILLHDVAGGGRQLRDRARIGRRAVGDHLGRAGAVLEGAGPARWLSEAPLKLLFERIEVPTGPDNLETRQSGTRQGAVVAIFARLEVVRAV